MRGEHDAGVRREPGEHDGNAAHQNRKATHSEVADDEFDRGNKTSVYAYFWLAKAALEVMRDGSAIFATSTETGIKGSPKLPDYSGTKGPSTR